MANKLPNIKTKISSKKKSKIKSKQTYSTHSSSPTHQQSPSHNGNQHTSDKNNGFNIKMVNDNLYIKPLSQRVGKLDVNDERNINNQMILNVGDEIKLNDRFCFLFSDKFAEVSGTKNIEGKVVEGNELLLNRNVRVAHSKLEIKLVEHIQLLKNRLASTQESLRETLLLCRTHKNRVIQKENEVVQLKELIDFLRSEKDTLQETYQECLENDKTKEVQAKYDKDKENWERDAVSWKRQLQDLQSALAEATDKNNFYRSHMSTLSSEQQVMKSVLATYNDMVDPVAKNAPKKKQSFLIRIENCHFQQGKKPCMLSLELLDPQGAKKNLVKTMHMPFMKPGKEYQLESLFAFQNVDPASAELHFKRTTVKEDYKTVSKSNLVGKISIPKLFSKRSHIVKDDQGNTVTFAVHQHFADKDAISKTYDASQQKIQQLKSELESLKNTHEKYRRTYDKEKRATSPPKPKDVVHIETQTSSIDKSDILTQTDVVKISTQVDMDQKHVQTDIIEKEETVIVKEDLVLEEKNDNFEEKDEIVVEEKLEEEIEKNQYEEQMVEKEEEKEEKEEEKMVDDEEEIDEKETEQLNDETNNKNMKKEKMSYDIRTLRERATLSYDDFKTYLEATTIKEALNPFFIAVPPTVFGTYLMDYYKHLAKTKPKHADQHLSTLSHYIMQYRQKRPEKFMNFAVDCIVSLFDELNSTSSQPTYPKTYQLLWIKLFATCYPLHASIETENPSIGQLLSIYIACVLSQCHIRHVKDITSALFLCDIVVQQSTNVGPLFLAEVYNFLVKLLMTSSTPIQNDTQFPNLQSERSDWLANDNFKTFQGTNNTISFQNIFFQRSSQFDFSSWQEQAYATTLHLLYAYLDSFKHHVAFEQLIRANFLSFLKNNLEYKAIQFFYNQLSTLIEDAVKQRKPLTYHKDAVHDFHYYEPNLFDDRDAGVKDHIQGLERLNLERKKLRKRVRRVFKAAVREIRRDTRYLATARAVERSRQDRDAKENYKRALRYIDQERSEQHHHDTSYEDDRKARKDLRKQRRKRHFSE